jgi:predicted MFS family arabinose efflux permease
LIFIAKAARVTAFGIASIMTPIYLARLGYDSIIVGISLMVIIAGNATSNIFVTWQSQRFGRRNALLLFSLLMAFSGLILFSTTSLPFILIALFIGNISTTGTEAGPFQSIETGVLPSIVGQKMTDRTFGIYNLIGYTAASVGAWLASLPSLWGEVIPAFQALYLAYGIAGLLLFAIYTQLKGIEADKSVIARRGVKAIRDLKTLSVLFSIDAFGGGFVTQSILSYWFFLVYSASLAELGDIFFIVNIITALSTLGSSFVAERFGNLRIMVGTHLLSNVFLLAIPFAGSYLGSLAFLFLRQSVSQMDVAPRQAFMATVFDPDDLVSANAVTNTLRILSSIVGGPASGIALSARLASLPLLAGGISKISYDFAIFAAYRNRFK